MANNIASTGKRVAAGFIDLILSFVFTALLGLMVGDTYIGTAQRGGFSFNFSGPSFVGGSFLLLLIFAWTEFTYGKTPGKFVCGTRVVAEMDGSPITLKQSLIRNLLRLIDGIFFYLVGFIIMIIDKNKQRLGDLAAKTLVIDERKQGIPI